MTAATACWYCGASERFPWTRWLLGHRLRPALTFFGFGPVPMCARCIEFKIGTAVDPRPEPPDYDSVPFTGNYSDLGAEEELRRDYHRDLEAWEARHAAS